MLKRFSIFLLILLSAASLSAASDKAISQTDLKTALSRIAALNAKTETVSADFTSQSTSSLSRRPIEAKGKIWLTREGNLRLSLQSDGQTEDFIYKASTSKVTFITGGTKTELKDPTGGIGISIMRVAGPSIGSELLKTYNVSGTQNASSWILTLSPKTKPLITMIKNVKVTISRKNGAVTHLVITMTDGSTTSYRFTNIRLNAKIPPKTFE